MFRVGREVYYRGSTAGSSSKVLRFYRSLFRGSVDPTSHHICVNLCDDLYTIDNLRALSLRMSHVYKCLSTVCLSVGLFD